MLSDAPCPFCSSSATHDQLRNGTDLFSCPRCGEFSLDETALADAQLYSFGKPHKRDAVSHLLRVAWERNRNHRTEIENREVATIFRTAILPNPPEQARNLILWLGNCPNNGLGAAEFVEVEQDTIASISGCSSTRAAVEYVLDYLRSCRIVETDSHLGQGKTYKPRLTVPGWQRFEELQFKNEKSRIGFMAMQFGDLNLDSAYVSCFKPAVLDAGFDLRRLDEGQGAGLIDDQLRVAIRTSKFLLAELTSKNRGAYWEAGFAEGLGLAVIYLCRSDVWADVTARPHFDTNHLVTVIWSPEKPEDARASLTAIIRNTFPGEANLGT